MRRDLPDDRQQRDIGGGGVDTLQDVRGGKRIAHRGPLRVERLRVEDGCGTQASESSEYDDGGKTDHAGTIPKPPEPTRRQAVTMRW